MVDRQASFRNPPSVPTFVPQLPHDRGRNWTVPLITTTAVLMLVAVGLEVVLLKNVSRRNDAREEVSADRPAAAPRSEAPAPPLASGRPAESISFTTLRPSPEARKSGNANGTPLVEVVGTLTAAHLYQTYLNIGLLADATEGEVYTTAEAKKLLDTLNSLLDVVEQKLAQIPESALEPEDRQSLAQTRALAALLRSQSKELRAYWETGEKDHANRFQKAREEAWMGIKDVLGIQD
jgi:hypothetical protein